MKRIAILLFLFSVMVRFSPAQQQEVPFTLADRDRLIRLEVQQEALQKEMSSLRSEMDAKMEILDVKIQSLDARMDYLFYLIGMIFALMLFMLGYLIWDRRTALNPVRMDVEQLKRENENMKTILRTYSEKVPQLKEILRNAGIL
jgi:hypothetical protein